MCYDCGQQCFQHPPKRSSRGTPKNFKRQLVPLAFRKTLKVSPTNWLLSAVIYKRRLLVTMDSSKRIIIFICVWLILSSVLLDHSQGFELRLTKKTRRLKHKPRKTQGNHHHYVKQMADLFSRFVVCMKGKNALFFCLVSQLYYSWSSPKRTSSGRELLVSVTGAGRLRECKGKVKGLKWSFASV